MNIGNPLYPNWHYSLYDGLRCGRSLESLQKQYSVTESKVITIFYNVSREMKGLPPIQEELKNFQINDQQESPEELHLSESEDEEYFLNPSPEVPLQVKLPGEENEG